MPILPTEIKEVIAHIDGGSRGNPGPAAYAVVIDRADGTRMASLSKYLGYTTNNVAEYQGLLAALTYALEQDYRYLKIISDSELLTRQINGQYKVRNPNLMVLYDRARSMIGRLESFRIEHVRREHNREADRLANQAMDAAEGKKKLSDAKPTNSKSLRATATYRRGVLELDHALPLAEGERINLEIHRRD